MVSMSPDTQPAGELAARLGRPVKRIDVDGESFWRVEGDMLLDDDQFERYVSQQEALEASQRAMRESGLELVATTQLVGITEGERIVRWAPDVELSYTVLRQTFAIGGEDGYQLAVERMAKATADWQNACGVRFVYKRELDGSDSLRPPGVLFVVREFDAGGEFIAAAFFPNDPINRRRVLIDPSFYSQNLSFDRTGVLRHELGHVLGFRHEHIRSGAPPQCPDEDTANTINLTDFDPTSVMHYFCGGVGSRDLALTEKDRIGSQRLYGLPLSSYQFVR
jgi:hypothetical protein